MFRSNRQLRRMFDKMGLDMVQLEDVEEVIIRTGKRELIIKKPTVTEIKTQDSTIYQVIGGEIEEVKKTKKFNEEDIMLVIQQTGVSREKAEKALEESEGDIARAILSLTTK